MPKVSDAHRQARRDEIADAAVRLLHREGRGATSISRIVEETGLSTGAIYANFENKTALARYIAEKLADWRVEELAARFDDREMHSPSEVLSALLEDLQDQAPPLAVVLQYWAEATSDPDLNAVLEAKLVQLRDAFEAAVRRWSDQRAGSDGAVLARQAATSMVVLCQGFLANSAMLGWVEPAEHLAALRSMFSSDSGTGEPGEGRY